jgi:hypothetical protein
MSRTPDLEPIRQEHESWLAELEGLAVEAIATNNWDAFYAHLIEFQNDHDLHGETGIAIGQNLTVRFCPPKKPAPIVCPAPVLTFSQRTKQIDKEILPLCH